MRAGRRRGGMAGRLLGGMAVLIAALAVFPVVMTKPVLSNPMDPASVALMPGFQRGRETGLPVPRFVSLKSRQARMRVGPSFDYATKWIYTARGLPVEITQEYGLWRRVRDDDGISGWMHSSLLSGKRTGVIGPWLKQSVPLRAEASAASGELAALEPRVRLSISSCDGKWCHVSLPAHDLSGYVRQGSIWGVYPNEVVK